MAGVAKLQAIFRGGHSRKMHKEYARNGEGLCPYLGTAKEVVHTMIDMACIKPNDIVYDLGCGDGRLVIEAAKLHGIKKGVGFEIDPVLVKTAERKLCEESLESVIEIRQCDVADVDLSEASVVLVFLTPNFLGSLSKRALQTMKPGSRLVSYTFEFPNWTADEVRTTLPHLPSEGLTSSEVFLYTIPESR